MGNGTAKLSYCCGGRHLAAAVTSDPYDEGLGHSFCYVRPDHPPTVTTTRKDSDEPTTIFRSISGASVSANLSTASLADPSFPPAAAFESSLSFSAVPLQPLSGPIVDRGFLSGPIERASLSGPLRRSLSHSLLRSLTKAISRATASFDPPVAADTIHPVVSQDPDTVQWAQGKAGEDRVHVVISEDHSWLFVGIYDGFSGPDATDHLLSNLYPSIQRHLSGLLLSDEDSAAPNHEPPTTATQQPPNSKKSSRRGIKKWEDRQRRWKCEFNRERLELEEQLSGGSSRTTAPLNHGEVLKAMARALKLTEEDYLDIADKMVSENPELALMGSCVLVMLMKGEDVYLMNVGDSRALLARTPPSVQDLARISEETMSDDDLPCLTPLQLTVDHTTCVEEEVRRIKREHPDDASAILNDRVKGSLKVTRAFGAGFLKQPKWNNALLEMFRIDFVGTSPYITCNPFLHHHRLGPKDRFLILSSDGLYQYLTNEEAVTIVQTFIATNPDGDPAQHLVEEVLFRAAEKAGIDFHELLEIPHGDRRRYHDDVSIIVISLEGRIWRSCL